MHRNDSPAQRISIVDEARSTTRTAVEKNQKSAAGAVDGEHVGNEALQDYCFSTWRCCDLNAGARRHGLSCTHEILWILGLVPDGVRDPPPPRAVYGSFLPAHRVLDGDVLECVHGPNGPRHEHAH